MAEGLGDKIVTIKLDAGQVREEMAATAAFLQAGVNRIRLSGSEIEAATQRRLRDELRLLKQVTGQTRAEIQLTNAKAQEAHQRFGVMANAVTGASTVMRLLTGESGFLAIELGRTTLYLGRAATAAGGFAAAISTIGLAVKGFLGAAATGLIAVLTSMVTLLTAIGAAAVVAWKKDEIVDWARSVRDAKDAAAALLEMQERLADAQANKQITKGIVGAKEKLAVARGEMSPEEARGRELVRGGEPLGFEIAAIEEQIRIQKISNDIKLHNLKVEQQEREKFVELQRNWAEEDQKTALENFKKQDEARLRGVREAREAIEDFEIKHGIRPASSVIGDPAGRRMAEFEERIAARRQAVEDAGGTRFSIGSRDASQFRFGFRGGDLIGTQSEDRNTDKILKGLKDVEKAEARVEAAIIRALGEGGNGMASFSPDLLGLGGIGP